MTGLKLAVFLACWLGCQSVPYYNRSLSRVNWDGSFVQFPIKRHRLQERLNKVNQLLDAPLYIPGNPVMQDLIADDEHVVQIAIGTENAISFEAVMSPDQEKEESPVTHVLAVQFPFLASQPGGSPGYNLQYAMFHPDSADHIESNVIFPAPIVADHLTVTVVSSGVKEIFLSKDDLTLTMKATEDASCTIPGADETGANKEYEHELSMSADGPDFSVCDDFTDLDVDFCDVYRDHQYRQTLIDSGSNVCLYWIPIGRLQTCESSFEIKDASQAMRDLLLIDESASLSVGAVHQTGSVKSRLIFPCIE